VECLALGCCVVGPELENRMPVPLVNGIHELRVRRDLAGLVETCAVLAADEEARRGLSLAAQRYFDQVLRREQLAGYYLHESLQRLRSFGEGGQAAAAADAG
jgi:hypothetical protein